MKKGNATLILIVLIGFTFIAWIGVFKGQKEDKEAYVNYLKLAEDFEKKEIYIDALENYEKALALDSKNFEISMKIADMYYELTDYNGFITACDNAIKINPKNPEPYIKKAEYYISKTQYSEAIKVIKSASGIKNNKELEALKVTLSTKYIEKYVSFSTISDWHVQGDLNYVPVQSNEKWGMTLKDGTKKIRMLFEYLGAYDEETEVIPCCLDGDYYYVDLKGNKKLVGDKEYQYLGSFGCGLAPAQRKNKYGYIDTKFKEQKFEYDYAGAFANGVAAVEKNGKWALINEKLENITKFTYDEILLDSYGFCSVFNVIIVRQGEEYIFLNHKGDVISKESFDGAKLPASNDSYIAVKKGDSWGYADQNGEIIISPKYKDAKSFSLGLAPVLIEEKWGYINTAEEIMIEAKYDDAGVFSSDGSAPVLNYTAWNLLVLCEYDE